MNPVTSQKTCKMCCMEIPKEARKCPFCHHFQNRVVLVLYHPAFAVLLTSLPVFAGLFLFSTTISTIFDQGEPYENFRDQIVITESQIAFGETSSGATVAVMGTLQNTSPVSWKDIQFHIDFLDASGRRIDVGERENFQTRLPANASSTFKVSFRREFPETNYAKHTVRIMAAKDAKARW